MNKKNEALKMAIDIIEDDLMDLVYEQDTDFKSKYAGGYKPNRLKYAAELIERTKAVIQQCKEALEEKEWQGLSDQEIHQIRNAVNMGYYEFDENNFARAIEQKLKEKNHG